MNADKMIEILRQYGLTNGGSLGRHMGIMDDAADMLESQAAQIAELTAQLAEKTTIKLRTDEDVLTLDEAVDTINRLRKAFRQTKEQLAESQRRERAVVKMLSGHCFSCSFVNDCAKHDNNDAAPSVWYHGDCEEWEYSGPQGARRGVAE